MKVFAVLVTLVTTAAALQDPFYLSSPYRYRCEKEKCIQEEFAARPPQTQTQGQQQQHHQGPYTSLAECNLVCGKYGSLWPRPTGDVSLDRVTVRFLPQNIRFTKVATSPEVRAMLLEQAHVFLRNLHFMNPNYPRNSKGPFTEHVERKCQNYGRRSYHISDCIKSGDCPSNGGLLDIFTSDYQLSRNQQQSSSLDQMRYEEISPFNWHQFDPVTERHQVNITITTSGEETRLRLDSDETYRLTLQTDGDTTKVTITSPQYFGARHALETLSQLINYDEFTNGLQIVKSSEISDGPEFKYRGLLLDTGRNFYPKEEILSLLDTMATNKLNTFHWHISDTASFPWYSKREPLMAYYGAYSPSKVYYQKDVCEIVEYANQRGIRVVPELDMPAHAGAGWNFGDKSRDNKIVSCNGLGADWFHFCNEPPCGQLNPTNPEVYKIILNVFMDILEAFDPEIVHMGGDGVSFRCWSNSTDITTFLTSQSREVNSRELFELWNTFQTQAYAKLKEAEKSTRIPKPVTPMYYSSPFVSNYLDPKKYIIQIIREANHSAIERYISNGYKVVFSNRDVWSFEEPYRWFDGGKSTRKADCLPTWREVYENDPLGMLKDLGVENPRAKHNTPDQQVLGGEVLIWSYLNDAGSLQPTAWPRGAALAERLWTDPHEVTADQVGDLANRMEIHRERMVDQGIRAQAFEPEFCFQNQDTCPQ